MAKLIPEYELVLMLDPEVPDERREEIAVSARRRIEEGATLKQERTWGTRKMSYEIQQRNEADYRFFRFENGKGILDDLNHNLKITDGVLRFRIYKVDPRTPVIDPPPPLTFTPGSDRPSGGRGRRDGGYEDRPPRAPDSDTSESYDGAAAPAPAAPAAEAPAAEAPAADAPAAEAPPAEAAPAEAEPAAAAPAEAAPEAPAEPAAEAPAAPADAPEAETADGEQPAE